MSAALRRSPSPGQQRMGSIAIRPAGQGSRAAHALLQEAVAVAVETLCYMLADVDEGLVRRLAELGAELAIIGTKQNTTDIPPHRWGPAGLRGLPPCLSGPQSWRPTRVSAALPVQVAGASPCHHRRTLKPTARCTPSCPLCLPPLPAPAATCAACRAATAAGPTTRPAGGWAARSPAPPPASGRRTC